MADAVGNLTWKQKSLIIGCILGDGHLRKMEGRKDAFLEINHSIKAKEYVNFKYEILKSICKSPPKKRRIDEKRIGYRFFTEQHPELTKLHLKFYRGKKKIIPKDLELNGLILAVWLMDDGSFSRGNLYLNTQKFSFKDQRRLLHFLRKIGIKARMNKDKKYYRIRIKKESIERFKNLVKPYIIPSMAYKLPS